MAWTFETAAFFAAIAGLLVAMTVWEILVPGGARRRGILAIDTTRGDRLFISLLGGAYIHLGWLALLGSPLWGAMVVTLVFAGAVFRWV
jgi:predicted small integral membrane protein